MKLKCGLTVEERAAKEEARKARRKKQWDKLVSPDTIFALWPKRIKPGDCRVFERVKRVPTLVLFEGRWSEWMPIGRPGSEHYEDMKWRYVHGGRRVRLIQYAYESIED